HGAEQGQRLARGALVGGVADDGGHHEEADEEAAGGTDEIGDAAAGGKDGQAQRALEQVERHGGHADAQAEGSREAGNGEALQRHGHGPDRNVDLGGQRDQQRAQDDDGDIGG